MTAKHVDRRDFEDQEAYSGDLLKLFAAVALIGLSLLLMYVAVTPPQPDTLMGAIQNVLFGLGGRLAPALPLLTAWIGVMCARSIGGHRVAAWRTVVYFALALCVFAAVHIFYAQAVAQTMTIQGFSNFVAKSSRLQTGGGALGALICWPLYRSFGKVGGFLGILLIMLLLLTLTGWTVRFGRWVFGSLSVAAERGQARRAMKAERRAQIEREFEEMELQPAPRPERQPRTAPRKSRDPHSEAMITGAPMGDRRRPAGRTQRPSRPVAQPARPEAQAAGERPAVAKGQPARRKQQIDKPKEIDFESEIEAAAAKGKRRAAESAAEQPRKRAAKKPAEAAPAVGQPIDIPEEDIPVNDFIAALKPKPVRPAKPAAKAEPGTLTAEDMAAMGFDTMTMDEYDLMDAEAILAEKQEREGFNPDRPASLKKKAAADSAQAVEAEEPAMSEAAAAERMEALKIKPVEYEKADDEAPFDIPEPDMGIAKAKTLPKLKRAEVIEEEEIEYNYPPIDLLAQGEAYDSSGHAQKDMEKAQLLEDTLKSFGINSRLIGIAHGPAVTRFELQPAAGVKVSRITSLSDDIALNLAAMSVRIEAPIPGKAAVGVEIPNDKIEMVRLRDVLESSEARKHPSKIAVGLGKDNSGRYIVADIAKMPHVLIAGQTGSGKSVCINSIITSILFRATPEEVRLILIDPKVVELSIYNDIPHLVCPVVTDPKKAASALDWAVAEMTKRYKLFAERGVRDIKGYNKALKAGEKLMPQMVIIIDELADLMMVSPGEVEDSICRLAQLARACGMHLVIATQRPSVNVITGIIKANIPTRIAFSVASQVDSRTMIDHGGAEKLLGNGDMLFVPNGVGKPMRVQGAWVSDDEVHSIVNYIKQSAGTTYDPDMVEHMENAVRTDAEKEELSDEYDPRLPEAVDIVLELGQASTSMLQRRMRVGYARAGRLIDELARRGIISEADGSKPRTILMTREQINQLFED